MPNPGHRAQVNAAKPRDIPQAVNATRSDVVPRPTERLHNLAESLEKEVMRLYESSCRLTGGVSIDLPALPEPTGTVDAAANRLGNLVTQVMILNDRLESL